MKKTEMIHVTGMSSFRDQINELAEHNPEYDLTVQECAEAGLVGERIYEQLFSFGAVRLETVPGEETQETQTCRIRILADERQVGWVKPAECAQVKEWLDQGAVRSLSLSLQGGPYRMIYPGEEGLPGTDVSEEELPDTDVSEKEPSGEQFVEERAQAGYFAVLKAECEFPEPAEQEEKAESGFSNAIVSTTYETRILEEDPRRKGFGFLLLAAMLTVFYLSFSGFYWVMVRLGRTAALPLFGGNLPDKLLYPHLGLVAAALLFTLLAIGLKSSFWAILAALAYAGSAYTLPGYIIFVALQALLCIFAALRRPGKKGMILVKLLGFAAVAAGLFWFLRPVVLDVMDTGTLTIRPLGSDAAEESTEYAQEQYLQDEGYGDDEGYGYDEYGDDLQDGEYGEEEFDDEDYEEDYEDDDFRQYDFGDENM